MTGQTDMGISYDPEWGRESDERRNEWTITIL